MLTKQLAASYAKPVPSDAPRTIFLTGATGFLGAFILRDLLSRTSQVKKVICHVRAKTVDAAMSRLRESGEGRGAWDEAWVEQGLIEAVVGDLDSAQLGMADDVWGRVAAESEVIVHNGALVGLSPLCSLICYTDWLTRDPP